MYNKFLKEVGFQLPSHIKSANSSNSLKLNLPSYFVPGLNALRNETHTEIRVCYFLPINFSLYSDDLINILSLENII